MVALLGVSASFPRGVGGVGVLGLVGWNRGWAVFVSVWTEPGSSPVRSDPRIVLRVGLVEGPAMADCFRWDGNVGGGC